METLSCLVSIAGQGALEERRLRPFLYFFGEKEQLPRFILVWPFCHFVFSIFASDVKVAASRTFRVLLCDELWLSAINPRADNTVIKVAENSF